MATSNQQSLPKTTSRRRHSLSAAWTRSLVGLLLAGILCACGGQPAFHAYRSLPAEGWRPTDTLCYAFELNDSTPCRYNLSVEVRHCSNYPYRNLNVVLAITLPDSTRPAPPDTLQIFLADETGRWQGTGLGALYQTSHSAGVLPVNQAGTYQIKITHCLADSLLQGVSDVGIFLNR